MSHEGLETKLVYMANQIAKFFASELDEQPAVAATENHLRKFWEPRMRNKIVAYTRDGGAHGLSDIAYAAVKKLSDTSAPAH